MKRIFILLFGLLFLSSCMKVPNNSTTVASKTPEISSQNVSSATDISSVDGKYSFLEIDALYGPGAFSVNDLAKIFGEPTYLYGYCFGKKSYALNVRFKDVMFDLVANNGEELSYANGTQSYDYLKGYTITESDKSVRMKPFAVDISDEKWPLLRNMKLGDNRDKLTGAYHGDKGRDEIAEGCLSVWYDYGKSGSVAYEFEDEKGNCLESVSIFWYDIKLLR